MKSSDIAALYNRVPLGAIVQIVSDRLPKVSNLSPPPVETLMARNEEAKGREAGSSRRRDRAPRMLNRRASIAKNITRA